MSLKKKPPDAVISSLALQGTDFANVLVSISTDINAEGKKNIQWLIADREKVLIYGGSSLKNPIYTFTFSEISDVRNSVAIGSGLLQIKIEGVWLDLLRFENRQKYLFDRALKRLRQIKNGEVLLPSEVDEHDPQRCPQCGLMLEFPGELCPRCVNHGVAISRVILMMRPYWKATAVLTVLLTLGIALDMAWPLLTRYLVDHVLVAVPANQIANQSTPIQAFSSMNVKAVLLLVVAALATVQILRGLINVFTGIISGRVGNALTFDVRAQLVRKLEELSLSYYNKQETGSIVGRIAYDTDAIQNFIAQITSGFLMQFLLVVISFIMMMTLEPSLALWAVLPAPFVLGGAVIYWRYVHPHYQRYWDRSSKQAGLLNGILSGIRVVKAFAQEDREYDRFQRASLDVRTSRQILDRTAAYFYPLMGLVFQVGGWIIWYVGGRHVLESKVTLGTLMAFFGYLSMFYGPLGSLTNLTTWLTQFSTQMHRIYEILDTPTILPVSEHPIALTADRSGLVEFKNITFGYSRGVPVLKDLSLTIRPGEKIGIVGRSGSGKTSLINLLCRFYDVDSGQITIDGMDIRNIPKDDLRSRISIVLQETFLFHGTLRENIIYGRPDATMEQIIFASRSAAAHDFIMKHQLAYDTPVGERGQELSGGERQRISIARALLCEPSILILDEATANIDSDSELSVQAALDELRSTVGRRTTMLVVAHRLSTLENCDRIYVIDDGTVVESGAHRELLQKDGRYARWVRIQQGKSYVEADASGKPIKENRKSNPYLHSNWLNPTKDFFERGPRKELQLDIDGKGIYRGIFALRCFPVQFPERYISLRYVNEEGRAEEIGLIRDLEEWPQLTRELVRESLRRRYLFQVVEKIVAIKKFAQFLAFNTLTDTGPVEFIMRHSPDSAQDYGAKGKLITDLEDSMYLIPDVSELSKSERDLYERYIYW